MTYHILAINPGSTSTKTAFYENEQERWRESLEHSRQELEAYERIVDQHHMRKESILLLLEKHKISLNTLSAVVGRGGLLPLVRSGAYEVNDIMVERLCTNPVAEHASNLGAMIARDIAGPLDIPAYIYDAVSVDELQEVARISGWPELPRKSLIHALNMRAAALKTARHLEKPYDELRLIVVHLGGGITMSVHAGGKMIDVLSDDEGPFSPERTGRVPCIALAKLCFSGQYTEREILQMLRGKGGLIAYLGTDKVTELETMVQANQRDAILLFDALAYQIAKGIGELSIVLRGQIDRIVLTGGMAYSEKLTQTITEQVQFLAPVEILPGENELEALALGTLRVLRGKELAYEYFED
ncbi:butyrate kinase [candidate division KSB3 bacterium]|uniref:Probable butyrate kinase n=1 Tax=candidate division KSB3 bacterium TaxID=2044937 RepID=A0A2G6KBG2_9BACT|nr:MAG: butyrate kinase [candidate division KSB3 bacterium]